MRRALRSKPRRPQQADGLTRDRGDQRIAACRRQAIVVFRLLLTGVAIGDLRIGLGLQWPQQRMRIGFIA